MHKNGVNFDSVFFNTIIAGLCYNRMPILAMKVTLEALNDNIRLNSRVINNLMKNVCG